MSSENEQTSFLNLPGSISRNFSKQLIELSTIENLLSLLEKNSWNVSIYNCVCKKLCIHDFFFVMILQN